MNDWLSTRPTRSATVLNSMNQPVTPSALHKTSSSSFVDHSWPKEATSSSTFTGFSISPPSLRLGLLSGYAFNICASRGLTS